MYSSIFLFSEENLNMIILLLRGTSCVFLFLREHLSKYLSMYCDSQEEFWQMFKLLRENFSLFCLPKGPLSVFLLQWMHFYMCVRSHEVSWAYFGCKKGSLKCVLTPKRKVPHVLMRRKGQISVIQQPRWTLSTCYGSQKETFCVFWLKKRALYCMFLFSSGHLNSSWL